MPIQLPNLWPETIKVDTLSPITILRYQAAQLKQVTGGLLEGVVESVDTEKGQSRNQFDIIAPLLEGYRHRILTATHPGNLVYPVIVESITTTPQRSHSQEEFIEVLGEIFNSSAVVSVIQSLIARSNDMKQAKK